MADKIKSFFQKKIKDEKFKKAGKGHKLSETSSSASASSSTSSSLPKRHEPTDEARIAGQAALARLEGQKTNVPKLNTSYAAIQARVRKELEQEKLMLANQKTQEQTESTQIISKSNHILAVSGVFYQCPLILDEILDKETWFDKIEEFLTAQLIEDEAGLSACLVINSCNDEEEKINTCVDTLCKYLENIRNDPSETKYWKIRMSNKVFQEKVKPLKGTMDLLKAAGFKQEVLKHQDRDEDFLVWDPERSTVDNLSTLIDALRSSESVKLLLDRNVQVLLPNQAAERSELPPQFFQLSTDDVKREHNEKSKAVERNQMLMTQAMREKLTKDKERKYKFTLIRIRFPDNIILQGTFEVSENYLEVVNFVKEHLLNNQLPFYLITATREKLGEDDFEKTLESLNLVPAVVLTFWDNSNSNEEKKDTRYLKEETLNLLQSM